MTEYRFVDRRPTTAGRRSASRWARRWASCSPASRATSATASAPTRRAPTPATRTTRPSRRRPTRRRPSCWPQADQLLAEADAALDDRRPRRVPGQGRRGQGARRPGPRSCIECRRPTAADVDGAVDARSAGRLSSLGQAGEVLAEGDLVAGLLVGEAHLAVAQLARARPRRPVAGGRAFRASMSLPSSVSWLASSVDTEVTRASSAASLAASSSRRGSSRRSGRDRRASSRAPSCPSA